MTVGDIAYADAWLKEEKGGYITPLNTSDNGAVYDRILNDFYNEVEEISSDTPYMVSPGQYFRTVALGFPTDVLVQVIMRPIATMAAILPFAWPARQISPVTALTGSK